jgi:hypothetical protein
VLLAGVSTLSGYSTLEMFFANSVKPPAMHGRFNKPIKHSQRVLSYERLDARVTLDGTASAAAGLPWFNVTELTYSFAPDGTVVGSEQSSLFAELSSTGSQAAWQNEFARAFDQWLNILGASIVDVPDSGAAFGSFGPTQGDTRFGDIRIGAVPLSGNVMAEAVPHSIIAEGSWAGDILLNSNADWSNLRQVYSVALHEFGHVLGIGHSDDPASPMFFHGVYDAVAPTQSDAIKLKKLYAGVNLESDSDESLHDEITHGTQWREAPHFQFDVGRAVPLEAALSANARYTASGALTTESPSVLFRLEPIGEIDHAEFLNVVVSAKQINGLISSVTVYDHSGDPIPSRVLHNSAGVLVIQARDVEPNHTYYIAVTPAATAEQFQQGEFELFAEYSLAALLPTQIGMYQLTAERPIVEQKFSVSTSRLVHILVSSSTSKIKNGNVAVWGNLIDGDNRVIAQLAMNFGESRSAPLVFLAPGNYTLILESGTRDGSAAIATSLKVFVDEISVDVGPGVVDPAMEPILNCDTVGADPQTCDILDPIIMVEGPIYPDLDTLPPSPTYPSLPPWPSLPWFYWPTFVVAESSYGHNTMNALDVSGDRLVSPMDVLLVVNELNAVQSTSKNTFFLDTSGDGLLSALDALLVINFLNTEMIASGEGPADVSVSRSSQSALTDQAISEFWALDFDRMPKRSRLLLS